MKTNLWLGGFAAVVLVAWAIATFNVYRLRTDLQAEHRFSAEKVQSLLHDNELLEKRLAAARVARNPTLIQLSKGDKTLDVTRHNIILMDSGGREKGTRLSATIFDDKGNTVLTHPTLSVQKGAVVVYPLPEESLQPGDYELQLFHQKDRIGNFRFSAVSGNRKDE